MLRNWRHCAVKNSSRSAAEELYALRVAELESLHTQDQESLRNLQALKYLQALPERVAELETALAQEGELRRAPEAAVTAQQQQIGEQQQQIATQQRQIGEQQQQIGDQQRQFANLQQQACRLNGELVESYRQIALREERTAELQRSWSWRIACVMDQPGPGGAQAAAARVDNSFQPPVIASVCQMTAGAKRRGKAAA